MTGGNAIATSRDVLVCPIFREVGGIALLGGDIPTGRKPGATLIHLPPEKWAHPVAPWPGAGLASSRRVCLAPSQRAACGTAL